MPRREDLYADIVDGDVNGILVETGELLLRSDFAGLEDTWLACLSTIGERMAAGTGFIGLWLAVAEEMHGLFMKVDENGGLPIRNAFRVSVSLMFLFRRLAAAGCNRVREKPTMGVLRGQIMDHFPVGAALTEAGARQFGVLLEGLTEEETAFAHRILAGMSRLWSTGGGAAEVGTAGEAVVKAIDYLVRKRLNIPLIGSREALGWLLPSREEGEKGDFTWFIWGMMILYFGKKGEAADIKMLHELYIWNWRRGVKSSRIGLVLGAGKMLGAPASDKDGSGGWLPDEIDLLQEIDMKTPEFWKKIKSSAAAAARDGSGSGSGTGSDSGGWGREDGDSGTGNDRMSVLMNHVPRQAKTVHRDFINGSGSGTEVSMDSSAESKTMKLRGVVGQSKTGSGSGSIVKQNWTPIV